MYSVVTVFSGRSIELIELTVLDLDHLTGPRTGDFQGGFEWLNPLSIHSLSVFARAAFHSQIIDSF